MEQTELVNLVAEILETDASNVGIDDKLEGIGWDSLSRLSFLAELDDRGISLSPDELAEARTVSDLLALASANR